jgi:hypothetical protein
MDATTPSRRHRYRYGCLRLSREFPTYGAIEAWPSQDDLAVSADQRMTLDDDQPKWQVIYHWSLSRRRFRIKDRRRDASRGPRCSNVGHLPHRQPSRAGGRWFIDHIKQTDAQQAQQPLLRSAARIGPPRATPTFSRPLVSEAMQIRIGRSRHAATQPGGFRNPA